MTTLFASDLDRTLIYSKGAATLGPADARQVCVEIHDGKQASWMTAGAAATLVRLAARGLVVPVTTRINEQYRRVDLPGPPPPFAITTNGGELLVDGAADRDWARAVAERLRAGFPLDSVWAQASHVCHPEFTVKLRNADDLFCYAVIRPKHLPSGFVEDIAGWAAERGWRTSLQGRKLYWVPESLTKSAAVAEVARRVDAGLVLAAGDSLLDVDLLLGAHRGIHPRHGELYEQGWSAPTVETTTASGMAAGEEITAWFETAAS
ncbi:HAD family hydrolase [Jatrophihabitans sp.]|uniref:HAD family hydrolase n=1 Tax=Jatrophihabitans sp. TaxID=1932789 RepID=UPI0030C73D89|nr:family hydrolase [Jatrophihabitans sp.]